MNKAITALLALSLSSCALLKPDEAPVASPEAAKPVVAVTPEPKVVKTVKLRNTYYLILDESRYAPGTEASILTMSGSLIAKVSASYKKGLDIEGTGRLRDGRVVNYAGRGADKSVRYLVSKAPFGYGVGGCPLVPFKTIAIDKNVVPYGSTVRIKETVGMVLPDGSKHDGLWKAEDTGGAIKNDRLDFFLGLDHKGVTLDKAKIRHMQPMTVEILDTPIVFPCT